MGWLFGRKKDAAKVPFPKGMEEGALRLGRISGSKVIEPEKLREAAGVDRPAEEFIVPPKKEGFPRKKEGAAIPTFPSRQVIVQEYHPLFIKVDSYQRVLGELDSIKDQLAALGEVSRKLESSEYNEEKNFASLQRGTKGIHDHLLQIDTTIFKSRGE